MSEPWLFVYSVIIIPAFETLTGQLVFIEILRWLRAPAMLSIVSSAAVFGVGHYVNGGIGHGTTSFLSGLVFSYAYLSFRNQSVGRSFLCAWSSHALHNFLLLYVVAKLLGLSWAAGDA